MPVVAVERRGETERKPKKTKWGPPDEGIPEVLLVGLPQRSLRDPLPGLRASPRYGPALKQPRGAIHLDLDIDVLHQLDALIAQRRNMWGYTNSSRRKVIQEALSEYFERYPD